MGRLLRRIELRIERPAQCHLSRSRPVAFERPNQFTNAASFTRSALCNEESQFEPQQEHRQQFEQQQREGLSRMQSATLCPHHAPNCGQFHLRNFPSHNQVAQPFVRSTSQQQYYNSACQPKILVNDRPSRSLNNNAPTGCSQCWRGKQQENENNYAYNRLISATQAPTYANIGCPINLQQQQGAPVDWHEYPEHQIAGSRLPSRVVARERFRPAALSSNSVLPDSKSSEYMWFKQLERRSIAHQTYRTQPIVSPKPKARHDLATGTYMRYSQDPTWELTAANKPAGGAKDHNRKIWQAIKGGGDGDSSNIVGAGAPNGQPGGGLRSDQPAGSQHQQRPILVNATDAKSNLGAEETALAAFNYRDYIEAQRRFR